MAGTISGGIKFAGLGSGVKFDEMVTELKKTQSINKTRLEYWKGDWQKRYDAFEELLTSISSLNETLSGFNNINKILSKAVTSSTTSVATAKAAADAPEGTHSLEVTQLATNAVLTNSVVFKDKQAPVSPDKDTVFVYTYKDKTQTVKVPRGASIQTMVDQINKDATASKVNVSANLVKSGDGYVFQIQGKDTGVKSDLTISGATSVPNFTPKTVRSSVTLAKGSSFIGNTFGADGLKFSYGTAPNPLPEGKTIADYVTEFSFPPKIANAFQTTSRYANGKDVLQEELSFSYGGKNYSFGTTNNQAFKSGQAYSSGEPITETIEFSYNGKDYKFEPDEKTTLADVQNEIKAIGGKDVSVSLVDEYKEDGKTPTGKKFLQVKANKVDVPVYDDEYFYDSPETPITNEIRFTTPNGQELVFPADGTRNLTEVAEAINGDANAGVRAKVVKDETGKYNLQVTENKQLEEGIEVKSGGSNPPRTINEVVNAINADTATVGISAKLVETDTGFALRVQGKEDVPFVSGAADATSPAPGETPDPDAANLDFEDAQRTLQDVVNEINEKGNSKGLFASVYNNADGTVSLDLRANDTSLIHADDKFVQTGPAVNTWSKRAAQDAKYKLDGLEFEFSSTTNELKDVIPGLTVNLTDLGKTTLTTTTDTSKVQENVESFVDGVNELLAKFTELTKFDKDKDTSEAVRQTGKESWETAFAGSQLALQKGGVLTGNYGVTLLNSQIKNIVSSAGLGFRVPKTKDDEIDKFYSLSAIGIVMDADQSSPTFGQLKVREPEVDDEGNRKEGDFRTLDEALEEDPLAVAQLLAGSSGVSDMPGVSFDNTLDGMTKPGTYDMKYSIDENGNIGDVFIGGMRAQRTNAETNTYSLQSGPGAGLTVSITDLTPGDYKGTVRLKQGKVSQLCETLDYQLRDDPRDLGVNAKRGPLKVLQANYKDIMDNIDKKIEQEEKRIDQWERRMTLRFSRLDTLLAQYNQKSQANASALATMPKIE